jgi:hypothetical protein
VNSPISTFDSHERPPSDKTLDPPAIALPLPRQQSLNAAEGDGEPSVLQPRLGKEKGLDMIVLFAQPQWGAEEKIPDTHVRSSLRLVGSKAMVLFIHPSSLERASLKD